MTLPLKNSVRDKNIFLTGFSSLLRSCTDFRLYKEVFYQPLGKTLRYLLLLVLLVTVVLGIRYSIGFSKFSKKGLKWIEENVPYIEINEGVVTADVEQPFVMEEEGFILIIDTTGEIHEIDPQCDAGILLTKDKLIFRQSDVRTQTIDLGKIKKFRLDKETLRKWQKFFISVIIPFMIIMQFVYTVIAKVIQALVFGLLILIFKPQFRYTNILNICVYALTPPTLLALVVTLLTPKPLLYFPLIYLGMYVAFLIGGIKQIQTK